MKKICTLTGILFMITCLCGCIGTEVVNNPMPIVWGGISFFPASMENSFNQVVLNRVKFSGYGKTGTIDRVILKGDETIVENLSSDVYTAKRQVWKGVSGQYREALEFFLSDEYKKIYKTHSVSGIPKFNIEEYECADSTWIADKNTIITIASMRGKDLSFNSVRDSEATGILVRTPGDPDVKIEKGSLTRLFVPEDVDQNPEKIIVNNLQLDNLTVATLNAKIQILNLDYNDQKLKFGIENASIPGAILAELNIPNPPQTVEGSLNGKGQINNGKITADATLNLVNLVDLTADLTGQIKNDLPDKINFSLTDKGILSHISQEIKAQLMVLALFVPNGQAALVSFLAKPDQTLDGSISFTGSQPSFTFSVK